jgi:hypothetical protein
LSLGCLICSFLISCLYLIYHHYLPIVEFCMLYALFILHLFYFIYFAYYNTLTYFFLIILVKSSSYSTYENFNFIGLYNNVLPNAGFFYLSDWFVLLPYLLDKWMRSILFLDTNGIPVDDNICLIFFMVCSFFYFSYNYFLLL